jgi:hypothetical protein
MKALRHYLRFIAVVLSTLAVPAIAQLREVGTGVPGQSRVNEKAVLQDNSVEGELIRQHYVLLRAD